MKSPDLIWKKIRCPRNVPCSFPRYSSHFLFPSAPLQALLLEGCDLSTKPKVLPSPWFLLIHWYILILNDQCPSSRGPEIKIAPRQDWRFKTVQLWSEEGIWSEYGYGSIPIDTFIVGWTSIYQLFWGSLGTRLLTHPHMILFSISKNLSISQSPAKTRLKCRW